MVRPIEQTGKRVMEEALANYQAQVKAQQERVEQAINEARSKRRRVEEEAATAESMAADRPAVPRST